MEQLILLILPIDHDCPWDKSTSASLPRLYSSLVRDEIVVWIGLTSQLVFNFFLIVYNRTWNYTSESYHMKPLYVLSNKMAEWFYIMSQNKKFIIWHSCKG